MNKVGEFKNSSSTSTVMKSEMENSRVHCNFSFLLVYFFYGTTSLVTDRDIWPLHDRYISAHLAIPLKRLTDVLRDKKYVVMDLAPRVRLFWLGLRRCCSFWVRQTWSQKTLKISKNSTGKAFNTKLLIMY